MAVIEVNDKDYDFFVDWVEKVDESKTLVYSDTDCSHSSSEVKWIKTHITGVITNTVENLYSSLDVPEIKSQDIKGYHTIMKDLSNEEIKILSFDKDKRVPVFKKLKHIWKYKIKKKLYKLKVNNKEIILTETHSIMVKRDNEIIKISLKDLKFGDEIILIQGGTNGSKEKEITSVSNNETEV